MAVSSVFYFNPTCELAVVNGSFSYMSPLILQEMERDLAVLPFIFGTENDFVLTEYPPTAEFKQKLTDYGFKLPEFCSLAELEALTNSSLNELCPWGWSPVAHFRLKHLKNRCQGNFKNSPVFEWKEEHQKLYERSTSLDLLAEILCQQPPDWFIDHSMTGVKITRSEEIETLLEKYCPLVLKSPVSSSGRGIQIIRKKKLNTSNRQWISGVFNQQKYLVAEPFLEKLADLSFQFQVISHSEIEYLGYSVFETNSNGQYQGTLIHPEWTDILPEENKERLEEMIYRTATEIRKGLKSSFYAGYYQGFLGVDAMLFRQHGTLKMQPCIEVNCRMNMGILTMKLEQNIHPDANGKFALFHGSPGEYHYYANEQMHLNPPVVREGKLYSGFLPLVEPEEQKKFGVYISLGVAR